MTKDEIDQIRTLLRGEVEVEAKKTRHDSLMRFMELRSDLREVKDAVRDLQISQAKLEEGQARLEKRLSEQISREAKGLAELIRDEVFPKLVVHDEQITELQEEVGLKPRKH